MAEEIVNQKKKLKKEKVEKRKMKKKNENVEIFSNT